MKKLIIMLLFMNMASRVVLGNVVLNHISNIEINESVLEMSNTAKVTIPRAYLPLSSVMELFSVGDRVTIEAGYDGNLEREFTGYIREIESDIPLVIHCDDETYPLRQTDYVKSYQNATLKQILADIITKPMTFECPDVNLGRFQIDHESAYQVLQRIKEDYGLYSRLQNGFLKVNLRDIVNASEIDHTHTYLINAVNPDGNFIKKNELKYKRKEDYRLHVKVTAMLPSGKKTTVEVGNKTKEASVINITYPGKYTEAELKKIATSIYNKRCYNGYTGTITGFGLPRTHAGDALVIDDKTEPERSGKYMIEKVVVTYDESGFSRKNTLSYIIGDNA